MEIQFNRGKYAFTDRFFSAHGHDFELTGVETNDLGHTIDHVKNVRTGQHRNIERVALVRLLMEAGYKPIPMIL